MGACMNCDGHGTVLVNNSWFIADGYRNVRCAICEGTGQANDYRDWGGFLDFQRRARRQVAEWGCLVPARRAADAKRAFPASAIEGGTEP